MQFSPQHNGESDGWGDAAVSPSRIERIPSSAPMIFVGLLGGFRVERGDARLPVSGWQRRTAKTLTKVLATHLEHALHREQIVDLLWPGVELGSALNSLGKAVHAARRSLEPDLLPRQASSYLLLGDSMLSLNTEHVVIDADRFQELAGNALRSREIAAYERALAAYGGELLPEDRYEDWCAERRGVLVELRIRLLLELAEALDAQGLCNDSADRLREALREDPTRELVHRRLMRLYAHMGTPDQAVQQFHLCEAALRQELGLAPQRDTIALYEDVLANRVPPRPPAAQPDRPPVTACLPPAPQSPFLAPFVGREQQLRVLCETIADADKVGEGLIMLSGEAGVGKTRFLEELASEASRRGAALLWGGTGAHADHFACGPFAVALEGYAATRPEAERDELARRHPALARFVPSLGMGSQLPRLAADPGDDHLGLLTSIVRLLTDLARRQPVLLVLGDLHNIDLFSLDLIRYLAHLAANRPWLMIGAIREEELAAASELRRTVDAMIRERLCRKIELRCLGLSDCGEMVRAMHPSADVDDELVEQIYSQSRGNPLFVGELVHDLRGCHERARPTERSPAPGAGTPALLHILGSPPLASVDRITRRVLELVATAGVTRISLPDLRSGAGALDPPVSDAQLLDALDRGLELHLLEERNGGYAFRYPLIRAALYDGLAWHRREQLHAALAGTLAGNARPLAGNP